MIIGRKEELKIIKERLDNDGYELGVIYGQRRIGKTSIIIESVSSYKHIYFLARDDSYHNNLTYFSNEYKKFLNLSFVPSFNTFDELFDSVLEQVKDDKLVVIIDELPFLANAYPGIISYLQGFCDDIKRKGKNIKIILSGSNMSFMIDILTNKGKPLYQRATFKIFVQPMLLTDAVEMLNGLSNVDIAKYLSIFGNRPYYLEKIDKKKTFQENMVSLCFNSGSILIDAPNTTLPLGYTNNSTYVSILVALSSHKTKIQEIASYLKIDDKSLSTYLGRMLETGAIERRISFNGNRKNVYYIISDPFIRFYYRIIYPYLFDIERGLGKQVFKMLSSAIEGIIEHGFEDVAISYLEERNVEGSLPSVFSQFKNYKVDNSKLGRSIEIDVISESLDKKTLLVGEAKFGNKNVSIKVFEDLKEDASIFINQYENVLYFLFSRNSFSNDLLASKDLNINLISLDTMFGKN